MPKFVSLPKARVRAGNELAREIRLSAPFSPSELGKADGRQRQEDRSMAEERTGFSPSPGWADLQILRAIPGA
jgi:hypothetical protein